MAYLMSNPKINKSLPDNSNIIIYTTKHFKGYEEFNKENQKLQEELLAGGEKVVKVIKHEEKNTWTVIQLTSHK